jgi:acyl carrier protein
MENKHIDEILKKFNISYDENLKYKLDSVNFINLILEIEELFNVTINDFDLNKTYTVEKIINEFVNNKQ